jgi:hypothetical protein
MQCWRRSSSCSVFGSGVGMGFVHRQALDVARRVRSPAPTGARVRGVDVAVTVGLGLVVVLAVLSTHDGWPNLDSKHGRHGDDARIAR